MTSRLMPAACQLRHTASRSINRIAAASLAQHPRITSHAQQQQPRRSFAFSFVRRKLNDIVKLDLLYDKTPTEIKQLWTQYHSALAHKPQSESKQVAIGQQDEMTQMSLAHTMSAADYQLMQRNAKAHPLFVMPLFKHKVKPQQSSNNNPQKKRFAKASSELPPFHTMIFNFQTNHLLLTSLDHFKLRKQESTPWLLSTFFDDLANQKAIVLQRSDILSVDLTREEAYKLLHCIRFFYTHPACEQFLTAFTKNDPGFDISHVASVASEQWDKVVVPPEMTDTPSEKTSSSS